MTIEELKKEVVRLSVQQYEDEKADGFDPSIDTIVTETLDNELIYTKEQKDLVLDYLDEHGIADCKDMTIRAILETITQDVMEYAFNACADELG